MSPDKLISLIEESFSNYENEIDELTQTVGKLNERITELEDALDITQGDYHELVDQVRKANPELLL